MFRKVLTRVLPVILIAALLFIVAAAALAAPGYQTGDEQGLVEVATGAGDFTTLLEGLQETELVDTLSGEGPFTVFAPSDEAFAKLPPSTLQNLFANPEALRNVLLYHVVEGAVMADELTTMDQVESLTGQFLTVTTDTGMIMVGGAQVITADVEAANGVIHIIDIVLIPGTVQETLMAASTTVTGTVEMTGTMAMTETMPITGMITVTGTEEMTSTVCAEIYVVQSDESLSTIANQFLGSPRAFDRIVEATNAAAQTDVTLTTIDNPDIIVEGQRVCIPGLVETAEAMAGEAVMTGTTAMSPTMPMAPTIPEGQGVAVVENFSAFDAIFDITGNQMDTALIVPGGRQEFPLEPGMYQFNAHQPGGAFTFAPGTFEVREGEVTSISCSDSGRCIVLDISPPQMQEAQVMTETAVVLPTQPDIVAAALDNEQLATLATALQTAGLVEALQGTGPFTVFAPTDAAFASLPADQWAALLANPAELASVLRYHVAPSRLMAAELADQESIDTLQGQPLTIAVDGDAVTVNGVNVIQSDIEAANGVIHLIDQVLLPPESMEGSGS